MWAHLDFLAAFFFEAPFVPTLPTFLIEMAFGFTRSGVEMMRRVAAAAGARAVFLLFLFFERAAAAETFAFFPAFGVDGDARLAADGAEVGVVAADDALRFSVCFAGVGENGVLMAALLLLGAGVVDEVEAPPRALPRGGGGVAVLETGRSIGGAEAVLTSGDAEPPLGDETSASDAGENGTRSSRPGVLTRGTTDGVLVERPRAVDGDGAMVTDPGFFTRGSSSAAGATRPLLGRALARAGVSSEAMTGTSAFAPLAVTERRGADFRALLNRGVVYHFRILSSRS